jgi:transitional endoplasmic reticulum ATPase
LRRYLSTWKLKTEAMKPEIRLTPAQQTAAEHVLSGLPTGDVFALRARPGVGRTTVLRHIHAVAGGALLEIRAFLDALCAREPDAIEESFLAMLDAALAAHDLVIVDDLHLVTAIVDKFRYRRAFLLDAALTAILGEAVALKKKLIFGVEDDLPWPLRRRAVVTDIGEFTPDDYTCLCRAWLPPQAAGTLDFARIHRFAPLLTGHQLKNACQWFGAAQNAATETMVDYLREHYLSSNVEIDEVPPVDWRDLKGVDDVIHALEAKIALPFENDELAARFALKPKRGVLLAGPPGTGKTTIGRALAHRLKSKFFLIDGTVIAGCDDFFCKVQAIFEAARKNAPSIIFIDDTDVIFENKEDNGFYRYLLTMLDGLESASAARVCVIMTAMNVGSLPPAMVRSGRIELWLETRLPDAGARADILRNAVTGLPDPIGRADVDRLSPACRGLTGADLKAAVEDVKLLFAHDVSTGKHHRKIEEYFLEAFETVRSNQLSYARAKPARIAQPAPVGFAACAIDDRS